MVDNDMPDFIMEALFRGLNSQVEDLTLAIQHLSSYFMCIQLVIPLKYKERVINELEMLNDTLDNPIAYKIEEDKVGEEVGMFVLSIFNLGVMQKEVFLDQL